MILDIAKLVEDEEYRADSRHRFITDHFFAAEVIGYFDFNERAHRPAVNLYFPKNPALPIRDQHKKHKRLHLDPRHSFKTSLKRVDRLQWICAFPEEITILNNSATQPLAEEVSFKTALQFFRPKGASTRPLQLLFPELVVDKRPTGYWNTPCRRLYGAGDLDYTLDFTSPKTSQSGWHPLIIDYDDVEDADNSGITANHEVRQGVIDVCDQNENTLRDGGFIFIGGTRYHPRDWYGKCLQLAEQNPANWEILVRSSVKTKDGTKILPGEFPAEDDLELQFPEFQNLSYINLREKFYQNYESFMCFCAGSKVLMADWTEKNIEDMKVGDELIGFEKKAARDTRLVKTKVTRLYVRRAKAATFMTKCGRTTTCSLDHRFLRPPNGGELRYLPLKMGSKIVSVYTPTAMPSPTEQRELDWLGGMLDGEGSFQRGKVCISQHDGKNPEVFAAIKETLISLNIAFGLSKTHASTCIALSGGRSLVIRLLQYARMSKKQRVLNYLWGIKQISETVARRGGKTYPVVEHIEHLGEQVVYDIETETHNFVCDGFAVHNCQQQNDPQGGAVARFDEKLYRSCLIAPERIPLGGDVYMVWRPRYGGKPSMAKYSEGAVAKVLDGRIYVLDAWQGTYVPSGEAEKIVLQAKIHQADALMVIAVPGSEYVMIHARNEAARRNRSLKMQWTEFEEDDARRTAAMEQLEPLMKVGRVWFSTAISKAQECQNQFVHFGLMEEQGIIEAISKFADLVPLSQMRANMSEEELEWQRRRRDDALISAFLDQQGMNAVDEQARQKADAHLSAMSQTSYFLPPMPGGLDG